MTDAIENIKEGNGNSNREGFAIFKSSGKAYLKR